MLHDIGNRDWLKLFAKSLGVHLVLESAVEKGRPPDAEIEIANVIRANKAVENELFLLLYENIFNLGTSFPDHQRDQAQDYQR